jgi:hypothetical protein
LAGEGPAAPPLVQSAYQAASAASQLENFAGPPDQQLERLIDWLLK